MDPEIVIGIAGGLCVCRSIIVIIVVVLGIVISGKLHGIQYYALVPEQETDEPSAPYCRLIMYDFDKDGMKIGWSGTTVGGIGVDTGVEAKIGLVYDAIKNDKGYSAEITEELKHSSGSNDGLRLMRPNRVECGIMIAPVRIVDETTKVMVYDLNTQKQLQMPNFCGGSDPGIWLDKGSDHPADAFSNPDGMHAEPLIFGLILWGILRIVMSALGVVALAGTPDYFIEALGDDADMVYKACMNLIPFVLSMAGNFLIAPLQNMELHEECPEIVLSFYSGKTQWTQMILLCTCGLGSVCCNFAFCALNQAQEDSSCVNMVTFKIFTLAAIVNFAPLAVHGIWYAAAKGVLWSIFFGMEINLSVYWPEFELAAQINHFHIFAFLLTIFDFGSIFIGCILGCMKDGVTETKKVHPAP